MLSATAAAGVCHQETQGHPRPCARCQGGGGGSPDILCREQDIPAPSPQALATPHCRWNVPDGGCAWSTPEAPRVPAGQAPRPLTCVIWWPLAPVLQQGQHRDGPSTYHSGRGSDVTGRGEERFLLIVLASQLSLPVCPRAGSPQKRSRTEDKAFKTLNPIPPRRCQSTKVPSGQWSVDAHVHLCVLVHVFVHVCKYACVPMYVFTCGYVPVCLCACACMEVCAPVPVCACVLCLCVCA